MTSSGGEAVGKPGVAGVYTNQRLNLSKPWEGSRRTCQGFKPASGNPTGRHYRGASRNVRHGETVKPPAIERAGTETPHPTAGRARFLSRQRAGTTRRPSRQKWHSLLSRAIARLLSYLINLTFT